MTVAKAILAAAVIVEPHTRRGKMTRPGTGDGQRRELRTMKAYIIALNARSRSLSLPEITRRMGADPDPAYIHDRGDLGSRGDHCDLDASWRVESDAGDAATIEEHAQSLEDRLAKGGDCPAGEEAGDPEVSLTAGVMHDSYTVSVLLPLALINLANGFGASIEVNCYPTHFDEMN